MSENTYKSESERRMAQFLEAAGIDFDYDEKFFLKEQNAILFADFFNFAEDNFAEITFSEETSEEPKKSLFIFSQDGKFSSLEITEDKKIVNNGAWAAVMRCPSCSSIYFASSADAVCPKCKTEKCSVYTIGSDGIPGWFGVHSDSLFDDEDLKRKIASLPEADGLAEKIRSVAVLLSGKPREASLTTEKAKAFGKLSRTYPNMAEVLKYFRASLVRTKLRKSKAISFRPILLVGSPGCGKSSFAKELGSIVSGTAPLRVDLGNDVASFTLTGSDMSWRKSKCGLVLQSMFGDGKSGPLRNPVVILDEMDKIPSGGAHEVEGVFYSILERETALHFRDNYFDVPVDASGINYIATANDIKGIPSAILSRFQVFEIRDYSEKEFIENVIPNFYEKWIDFERIDRDAVPEKLSESIRRLVFSISGSDTRKISSAFDRVLEKTGRIDKASGKFIAFFSEAEIKGGWRNFAGKLQLPDAPFVI